MPGDFAVAEGIPALPKKIGKKITVEPPVFFFGMGFGMIIYANSSLTTQRTCREGSAIFGDGTTYNETVCENLTDAVFAEAERVVLMQTKSLNYISAALQAIPAIIFALFAGAWSDMYGRRFLIVLPLIGLIVLNIVFMIFAYIEVPPDWLLFEALQDITGGMSVLMMGAFAHAPDVSTPKWRTVRFGFLETAFLLGSTIGTGVSGPLYRISGHAPIYILSVFVVLLGIMAVPLFVKKPKIADRLEGKLVDLSHLRVRFIPLLFQA